MCGLCVLTGRLLEAGVLFETWRLLEVLRYLYSSYFLTIYMHADAVGIVIHSI